MPCYFKISNFSILSGLRFSKIGNRVIPTLRFVIRLGLIIVSGTFHITHSFPLFRAKIVTLIIRVYKIMRHSNLIHKH